MHLHTIEWQLNLGSFWGVNVAIGPNYQIEPVNEFVADQIVDNRTPYFDALDAADAAFAAGNIDVSKMEELIGGLLANQLATFYKAASGKLPEGAATTANN
jgi:hypothetical protein